MYCANCGTELDADASFCTECGHKVKQPASTAVTNSDPSFHESYETTSINDDVRDFVGEKYPFYRSKWDRMEEKGSPSSWNFPAFFFSTLWLGYRKMYREVFFIAILFLAIDFALYLFNYQYSADAVIDPIDRFISIGISMLLGLFGNYLYKKHTMKKVHAIRLAQPAEDVKHVSLKHKGEASFLGVLLSIVIMVVVYVIPMWFIPMNFDVVDQIKHGSFEQYPDRTVGEMFDEFFEHGEWQEATNDSNFIIVAYNGEKQINDYQYDIQIEFYTEEDSNSFDIQSITVDGEQLTSSETLDFLDYIFNGGHLQKNNSFNGGNNPDGYVW
ncbi:DUF2628 domain-containing protein [Lentibacillus sp. Marseille-P4043]|uniref:DUF2628 domain-containing protein n=1 Tax=Lentibacillus sp. Marseille-P4043 TaxID=2040293 RepID=UPI00131A4A32|nr:DUF2628 domain-containing protein [Lentibacillus sp. Marseille-P4043]